MSKVIRYTYPAGLPVTDMMNQMLNEAFALPRVLDRQWSSVPSSALYETNESFVAYIALPGVHAESVTLKVESNVLSLEGNYPTPAPPEGARAIWANLPVGQFRQTFTLPADVDAEHAEATFSDGMLTLVLPKMQHARVRTIKVSSGNGSKAIEGSPTNS